jgi:NTE family protein
MDKSGRERQREKTATPKVAIGCQGGGMHAAFEVGVLTEILADVKRNRFELVGLSGTSAGALNALMVWYGLAPKGGSPGSVADAVDSLNDFWENFVASTNASTVLNSLTYGAFRAQEAELLGISAPAFVLNPFGVISKAVAAFLPSLGVRQQYFDLENILDEACPQFDSIDWQTVKTRLLIGASEVVNGLATVFDSDVNKGTRPSQVRHWRQRLPLTLPGVAASGTLPTLREAQRIDGRYYWDGLYSQNPPVREFLAGIDVDKVPDELWVVRINPQQWPVLPRTMADIQDRQNELMGNLSLHQELDFILKVNKWHDRYKNERFGKEQKHVTVRTIMMKEETADELRYSSKFDRSREFMRQLRAEGREVARDWLDRWHRHEVGCYPEDAAYRKIGKRARRSQM